MDFWFRRKFVMAEAELRRRMTVGSTAASAVVDVLLVAVEQA